MTVRIQSNDAVTELPAPLAEELGGIVGPENVRTEAALRVEAGQDWWPISLVWAHDGDQPALPAAVVRPKTTEQVAEVLAAANRARVPVTPFAGRSGVCGGALPVRGGISLDLQRLDDVLAIDDHDLMVHAQAGVYGPIYEEALRRHGLTGGHFPQSFDIATVGGWVACRGAGQYSNRYGKIEEIVLGLEVALADGTVVRTNPVPAAATGPDLMRLFIGSEGTLGVITSVWLKAWPAPAATEQRAYTFDRLADAIDALRMIMRWGARPAVTRVYDGPESARFFSLPDDRNALVVLVEGEPEQVEFETGVVEAVVADFGDAARVEDPALVDKWLEHRNDVSALHEVVAKNIVVDTIEVAGPWSKLAGMYSAVQKAVFEAGAIMCTSHSSHAYLTGGCLYFTFAGMPGEEKAAKDAFYVGVWDAAMRAVRENGGTISHHHGIGLVRARFMEDELGAGLGVLRAVKKALDPNGILNPGKLGLDTAPWPAPLT